MNKKDQQYMNLMAKLDFNINVLERINSKLDLVAFNKDNKDNKKYYIKVTKEYLVECKDSSLDCYPYTLNTNGENEWFKSTFTLKEIEILRQDKDLNWLNWNNVTLEEVQDNETKQ